MPEEAYQIRRGDADQFEKITGQIIIIQGDISDLKKGQGIAIGKVTDTREGQKMLEGRFDTLEKVILGRAQMPVQTVQQGPIMSQMMKVILAALAVVGTALALVAKFATP